MVILTIVSLQLCRSPRGSLTYRRVVVQYYHEKPTCNCFPDYAVILKSRVEINQKTQEEPLESQLGDP